MRAFIRILSFICLGPLSYLWALVYRIRRFAYDYRFFKQSEFELPIISIGNLSFGGTGKTPFTLWLGDYLEEMGKKVVILTRGYKGRFEHSRGILESEHRVGMNPIDYGDEALLLARKLKSAAVIVGKNRSQNLRYYFDTNKHDVALLDDGFQHLKLARDLNIVLFDSLTPLSRYHTAPLGFLREGPTALKDAHAVILGRCDQVSRKKIDELAAYLRPYIRPETVIAEICYKQVGLFDENYSFQMELKELEGVPVICVAGIASPQSFFAVVESHGANVIKRLSFPDHHYFTTDEIQELIHLADKHNALIITTEKDIVKMRRMLGHGKILYLEIKVQFLKGELEIKNLIKSVI